MKKTYVVGNNGRVYHIAIDGEVKCSSCKLKGATWSDDVPHGFRACITCRRRVDWLEAREANIAALDSLKKKVRKFKWEMHGHVYVFTEVRGATQGDVTNALAWVKSYEQRKPHRFQGLMFIIQHDAFTADAWYEGSAKPYQLTLSDQSGYYASDKWAELRKAVINRDRHCVLCGRTGSVVHHNTYWRFGHERLTDLTLLCRACHDAFHRRRDVLR